MRPLALSGATFGELLALFSSGKDAGGNSQWVCLCSCGKEVTVRGARLISGHTKSCGHLRGPRNSHHLSGTRAYKIWQQVKQRCDNPKSQKYECYGAKGISLCDRWHSFENFYADMGECPEGMSIDRYPDNKGSYEPGNCRWATPKQQVRNREITLKVLFKGIEMPLAECAERLGITYHHAWGLYRKGEL